MNFDRTQVLNLSYSYQTGKFTTQRFAGRRSSTTGSSRESPTSRVAPTCRPASALRPATMCRATSDRARLPTVSSNTTILGTPDVNLQPVLKCNPTSGLGSHQYLNPNCFGLPATGTNGQYIEPYAHGPAFFNSDLTLEKGFGLGPIATCASALRASTS